MTSFPRVRTGKDACRVACFSDTFGAEANNGVARFLHDLQSRAEQQQLPWLLVFPGKGECGHGLYPVRAPSFTLPGYADTRLAMPLEHQRRSVARLLRNWRPDVIHVSTPGPFGCLGVSLAKQLRLPLVGIHHTDFPAYAYEIALQQLTRLRAHAGSSPQGWLDLLSPLLGEHRELYVAELRRANPRFDEDCEAAAALLMRNADVFLSGMEWTEMAARLARSAACRFLEKFYAQFHAVIARSPDQRRELERELRVEPRNVLTMTPGIDTERFHPRHRDPSAWDAQGIPRDAFLALYVGRITPEKNVDFLARVWRCLQSERRQSDPEFRLVIAGRGDSRTMDRIGREPGVHLMGPRGDRELSVIYASADVLLFPSTTETLGQVGLEAGASGLPVLVTDRGGPRHYVRHEQTGFVLPATDPAVWSERILVLARDAGLRSDLGAEARRHIAGGYSLEDSLRHYWELHRAVAYRVRRQKRLENRQVRLARRAALPSPHVQRAGVLVISDYHAGRKFGSDKQRSRKVAALEKMLRYAAQAQLRVIFGGDFGDHGSSPGRLEQDFLALREVRRRVGLSTTPIFVRGNHDYGFSDQQLIDFTGGCRIHPSLVYFDREARVTVTHGHVLGLQHVLDVIRSSPSAEELEDRLREDVLAEELKPSIIAYDLANLLAGFMRRKGLTGLGEFWERLFQSRAALAESLRSWGATAAGKDERTWKLLASLVGAHDDLDTAARLGAACGGWAAVFGHTHEPLARLLRVKVNENWAPTTQLVANSGNMNRKRPACLVARFPEVRVYRYYYESDTLRMAQRIELPEPDVQRHLNGWSANPQEARGSVAAS